MGIRRGLVVLVLATLLAGCGQRHSQRAAVAGYLTRVNRIEKTLTTPLSQVNQAISKFAQAQRSGGSLTNLVYASEEQQLLRAESRIRLAGHRLSALQPPRPAATLHRLLLQVNAAQAQLTHELARLVTFLPRFTAALRPLRPATSRLQAVLGQRSTAGAAAVSTVYASKAAALRRFQRTVEGILTQLRQLVPPAVQRAAYTSEVASLKGMSSAAGDLAASLQGGSPGNVQPLLLRFQRAATLNQSLGAQEARIADVRAYDAQIVRLARLGQAAQQERFRLANNLA
jgi:hypothetical protein